MNFWKRSKTVAVSVLAGFTVAASVVAPTASAIDVTHVGPHLSTTVIGHLTPNQNGRLTYWVSVGNDGTTSFDAAHPASIVIDTTDLGVAHATVDPSSVEVSTPGNAVSIAGDLLTWVGPLGSGSDLVIEFEADTLPAFDSSSPGRVNVAATTPGFATPTAPFSCDILSPQFAGSGSDCASTDWVYQAADLDVTMNRTSPDSFHRVGDTVSYEVELRNVSDHSYTDVAPAFVEVLLADLLDDATLDVDSLASSTGPVPVLDEDTLVWSGPLGAHGSVVLSFSAVLDGTGDQAVSASASAAPRLQDLPHGLADCGPSGQIESISCSETGTLAIKDLDVQVTKNTGVSNLRRGEQAEYTIVVTNAGEADFTVDRPLYVVDDLSDVIDDSEFSQDDVTAIHSGSGSGAIDYQAPRLTWEGPLSSGESITLTYPVTTYMSGEGNHHLASLVIAHDEPVAHASVPLVATDYRWTAASALGISVPGFVTNVTSTMTGDRPGDPVTYRVEATNNGSVDFDAREPAFVVTDIAAVLDDGVIDLDSITATRSGTVSFDSPRLTWVGSLAQGASVVIEFDVKTARPATGDLMLSPVSVASNNATVFPDGAALNCTTMIGAGSGADVAVACGTTTDNLLNTGLSLGKTVMTDGNYAGASFDYTLTLTNIGDATFTNARPAVIVDDLSRVVDDIDIDPDSITVTYRDGTVSPDGAATFDAATKKLTWKGALAPGDTVTVTYKAVAPPLLAGDDLVHGVAVAHDQPSKVPTGAFTACDDARLSLMASCAETITALIRPGHTVDTQSKVTKTGKSAKIAYWVKLTNSGTQATSASNLSYLAIDVSDVVDVAKFDRGSLSANRPGELTFDPTLQRVSWEGALQPGESVVVEFDAKVHVPLAGDKDAVLVAVGTHDPANISEAALECDSTQSDGYTSCDSVKHSFIATSHGAIGLQRTGGTVWAPLTMACLFVIAGSVALLRRRESWSASIDEAV